MNVSDIMTTEVKTVALDMPITKAADKMLRSKIHGLVVMQDSTAVGVISTFDLLKIVFMDQYKESFKIGDLIAKQQLKTVTSDMLVSKAAVVMVQNNIRTLPVVDDDKLVGILSMMDVMKVVIK